MRWWMTLVGAASIAAIGLALTTFLRACANEHYRPHGHTDITFGISPGGDTLVFNAVGEGGRDLYLLDLANLRVSRIARTPDYEVDPRFSPDGKSIVYAAGKPGDRADHIFIRSLDGKSVTQLTAGEFNDGTPECSPDSSLIVFAHDKTYQWGGKAANWTDRVLCLMKADGSEVREITGVEVFASDPHFSPDGKNVLFSGIGSLYTVAADGSGPPKPLGGLNGRDAVYAPDGQSVGFSMGRYADDQRIFVARADGTGTYKVAHPGEGHVTSLGGGCSRPAFTLDGKRIIFFLESWPDGPTGVPKESLWEIGLGGENPSKLAGYALFDDPLNWRP